MGIKESKKQDEQIKMKMCHTKKIKKAIVERTKKKMKKAVSQKKSRKILK